MESKKKYLIVMGNIYKHSCGKAWTCIEDGCDNKAINSHLLQRHGILDNIVEDGHTVEVMPADIMRWDEKDYDVFKFKKVGLQHAISLHVFCQHHDSSIFSEIEHGLVDYDKYHLQLLFSYRSLCAEIRKKQINLEMIDRMEKSKILNENPCNISTCRRQKEGTLIAIRDLDVYRKELRTELSSPSGLFSFYHYSYPITGVYASASFSYDSDASMIYGYGKSAESIVLDNCFIHIIPTEKTTEIIVGYSNNHTSESLINYAQSWKGLDLETLCRKLTNLFAGHIEGWGLSPSLFEKISHQKRNAFNDYVKENAMNYSIMQDVGFNLFEGCF